MTPSPLPGDRGPASHQPGRARSPLGLRGCAFGFGAPGDRGRRRPGELAARLRSDSEAPASRGAPVCHGIHQAQVFPGGDLAGLIAALHRQGTLSRAPVPLLPHARPRAVLSHLVPVGRRPRPTTGRGHPQHLPAPLAAQHAPGPALRSPHRQPRAPTSRRGPFPPRGALRPRARPQPPRAVAAPPAAVRAPRLGRSVSRGRAGRAPTCDPRALAAAQAAAPRSRRPTAARGGLSSLSGRPRSASASRPPARTPRRQLAAARPPPGGLALRERTGEAALAPWGCPAPPPSPPTPRWPPPSKPAAPVKPGASFTRGDVPAAPSPLAASPAVRGGKRVAGPGAGTSAPGISLGLRHVVARGVAAGVRAGGGSAAAQRAVRGSPALARGESSGRSRRTPAAGPRIALPPSARPGARARTPAAGGRWSLPGGWPCCSHKAGGAAAGGAEAAAASGSRSSQGAAASEARGRARPEPEQQQPASAGAPGAAGAGAAAAMAVAVGRPSVSAGAALRVPAAPPAPGGPRVRAGAGGE